MGDFYNGISVPALVPGVAFRIHKQPHALVVVVPVFGPQQPVNRIHEFGEFTVVPKWCQIEIIGIVWERLQALRLWAVQFVGQCAAPVGRCPQVAEKCSW